MIDRAEIQRAFGGYARLIEPLLAEQAPFAPAAESGFAVQIERGGIFPLALVAGRSSPRLVDRLVELAASPRLNELVIVDRLGHQRLTYRPLLTYAWLMGYRVLFETLERAEFSRWDEALRAWCDSLEGLLSQFVCPPTGVPASTGDAAAEAAWAALALFVAGKLFIRDPWTDLAAGVFGQLSRAQQPGGAFLIGSPSSNPETAWYHELAILHAAASYSVQAEDRTVAAAVERASRFHLNETEPDHATRQPWGVFAFIWNPGARPLADQLLHAARLRAGESADGVSLILLADCLYCLRLFL